MYLYQIFKKLFFGFLFIAIFTIALSSILEGNVWALTALNVILACAAFLFYYAYDETVKKNQTPEPVAAKVTASLNVKDFIEAQIFPTLVLDDEDMIVYLNQNMLEAFGDNIQPNQKNINIGRHFSTLIRAPHLLEAYEQVKQSNQPAQFNFEQVYNGDRHYWVNISPVKLSDATLLYAFTFRDLTKDQKTDRMRVDFVANASHELRTPLASISGFIETLQTSAKDDEKVRTTFLTIMQEQADRMTRLIDDLLSLSKIEMNIHSKPQDEVSLAQIIEHVLDSAKPLARDKNIELKFENHLDDDAIIKGDSDQLIQLLGNLVDNAFKYGLREGQDNKIILRLSENDEETDVKDKYIVSVIDFGHGIPQSDLPRLTERFYRVSNQHNAKGTGLGLAIAKHILQRHSGEIKFKSQIDKGTKVLLMFHKLTALA